MASTWTNVLPASSPGIAGYQQMTYFVAASFISPDFKTSAMHQQMGLIVLSWMLLRQPMCAQCHSKRPGLFVQWWILGILAYAIPWAITLVDGGMDLLKYSIIPCFFLWPAARLFNTYNSMLYRLNYQLQAETDWWLDCLNELPPPFSGHLSILYSSALFWPGIGKAASVWWTAQLDIIF